MKTYEKLSTIPNVAAGNTVTIKLPVGSLYEKVILAFTGVTLAQLENVRVELNDRIVSEYPDAARIASMNAHYNRADDTGFVTLHFTRPELDVTEKRRFFGLDTSQSQGIKSAQITLDIDSAATDPKITAYAEKSAPVQGMQNWLTKVRRHIVPVTSIGEFDIDNIQRPVGASIAAIHLYMADGADADSLCDITKANLLVNNVSWHDIQAGIGSVFQKLYGRVPQVAEATVIDLTLDNDVSHALPINATVQDLRIRATAAGTGNCELMVEYIDLWGSDRF